MQSSVSVSRKLDKKLITIGRSKYYNWRRGWDVCHIKEPSIDLVVSCRQFVAALGP